MTAPPKPAPPHPLPSVRRLPGFERDMRRLLKRYATLEEDLSTFTSATLRLLASGEYPPEPLGLFPVSGKEVGGRGFYVAEKFACRSLKGTGVNSGIRVVLQWLPETDEVCLVEIYHKNEKEVEDLERIRVILKGQ